MTTTLRHFFVSALISIVAASIAASAGVSPASTYTEVLSGDVDSTITLEGNLDRQLVDIEMRWDPVAFDSRFALTFHPVTGTIHHLIDSTEFQWLDFLADMQPRRGRWLDLEVGWFAGVKRWNAIFYEDGVEDYGYAIDSTSTDAGFQTHLFNNLQAGRSIIDFESYVEGGVTRFAGVWVEHAKQPKTVLYYNLESADFLDLIAPMHGRLIDVERYHSTLHNETRFAAIFAMYRGSAWAVDRTMTAGELDSNITDWSDGDTHLIDIDVWTDSMGDVFYSGVWGEDYKSLSQVTRIPANVDPEGYSSTLQNLIDNFPVAPQNADQLGFYAKNLRTNQSIGYNGGDLFYWASTVKNAIHIKLWMDIVAGHLSENDTMRFTNNTNLPSPWYVDERGFPGFSTYPNNSSDMGQDIAVDRFDQAMMSESDNAATSAIVDNSVWGLGASLSGTDLNEWIASVDGMGQGWGPVTSIHDVDRTIQWQGQQDSGRASDPSWFLIPGWALEAWGRADWVVCQGTNNRCQTAAECGGPPCMADRDPGGVITSQMGIGMGGSPPGIDWDQGFDRYFTQGLNSATPKAMAILLEKYWENEFFPEDIRDQSLANMGEGMEWNCTPPPSLNADCPFVGTGFRAPLAGPAFPKRLVNDDGQGNLVWGYWSKGGLKDDTSSESMIVTLGDNTIVMALATEENTRPFGTVRTNFSGPIGDELLQGLVPDLENPLPGNATFFPTTVQPGDTLYIIAQVRNVGGGDAQPFDVSFRISDNTSISFADDELGIDFVPALDGYTHANAILATTIPASVTPGTYTIGWIIDPRPANDTFGAVSEFNESNNIGAITGGLTLTVLAPDPGADCNGNTIGDECDLDCSAQGGACNVPGCGLSTDCDGNFVPDECDIGPDPDGCLYPVTVVENTTAAAASVFTGPPDGVYRGLGGQVVTYELDCGLIVDGPGPDFTVYEVGGDEFDNVDVLVSEDGLNYVSVIDDRTGRVPVPGDLSSGAPRSFDLRPSGTKVVRFVRIDGAGTGADGTSTGFDLDAIGVVNSMGLDCDTNGTFDQCDPGDCNANGIPESCELALGLVDNCEPNANPDTCDTLGGVDDCDGDSVPDSCEADCNINGVPDDCDIAAMTSDDCNANGIPDECDLSAATINFSSGSLTPIGRYSSRSTVIPSAPAASSSVIVTVTGVGDFDASNEYLDIDLNGVPLGRLFDTGGLNCAASPQQLILPAETYNSALALTRDAVFTAVAPSAVSAAECGESYVRIDVFYDTIVDCNTNATLDYCDIDAGFSFDLNGNSIVDECDPDCNGNGTPDDYDVLQGLSPDCNNNLNPDECDVASMASQDCNTDGVPDECQPDCNTNSVPDDCDIAAMTSQDCDGNVRPDECDLALANACVFPTALLDNGTGADPSTFAGPPDDVFFGLGGQVVTYDLDCGVIADGPGRDFNIYEVDSGSPEFNSLEDVLVSQDGLSFFSVKNTEDAAPPIAGDEQHGSARFARSYDLSGTGLAWVRYVRLDGSGTGAAGSSTGFDLDAMGVIHVLDQDCDDSGTLDVCEALADCDASGLPDSCEIAIVENTDCNANMTLDVCDVAGMSSSDCDGNLVPDECQADCNANTTADTCDIVAMTSDDCNGNAQPDECEIPQAMVMEDLGTQSPLSNGFPQSYALIAPLVAGGPVTVTVTAIGDYGASNEWIDVDLNGTQVGRVFETTGSQCLEQAEALVLPASQFNDLVGGGDAVITLTTSTSVVSFECTEARAQVELAYDSAQDCNTNSTLDFCDVDSGGSPDCNTNGSPDECEADCNTNGVPDDCDIAAMTSDDCDGNGVPDECDLADPDQDCNINGIVDACDIAAQTSSDCNDNGRPDECDLSDGTSQDCNTDSLPDECPACPLVEVAFIMDTSSSMNDEGAALCADLAQVVADLQADLVNVDTELLGIMAPGTGGFSCLAESVAGNYGTTVPGSPPPGNETLGDCPGGNEVGSEDWGRATSVVAGNKPWQADSARLVVPIADEGPWCGDPASDPGVDRDSINHGIITALANDVIVSPITGSGSGGAVIGMATDLANGTGGEVFSSTEPAADLSSGIRTIIFEACDAVGDCNDNDVPDECDIGSGTSQDCDVDGVPDECQADCNNNGVLDSCDIASMTSPDDNANAIPDECEVLVLTMDATDMLWTAVPQALGYDVVDGDLGLLRFSAGDFATSTSSCMVNDHPGVVLTQGPDPAVGQIYFYLVRAVLGTGVLTYDAPGTSQVEPRDAEVAASGVDCP